MSVWLVSKGLIVESTTITISDIYLIGATLVAPFFAVYIQRLLDEWKEKRNRKFWIFSTLMATRAARVSDRHIEALNMIDVEYYTKWYNFDKQKAKDVRDAWKTYFDCLKNSSMQNSDFNGWITKGDELFVDLLYKIALSNGYSFDKVDLKNNI